MHHITRNKKSLFTPIIMVLLGIILLLLGILVILLSIRNADIIEAQRESNSEVIDFGPSYLDTITKNPYSGDGGQAIKAYLDSKTAMAQENPENINASIENAVLTRVRCEILSSDIAAAHIRITAPDLAELLERAGKDAGSIEECGILILEALESDNYQTKTTELDINIDEFGKPSDSYAFFDTIYGGMLTQLEQYFAEPLEGIS
ncbi:MAG: hypothetical protein VB068_10710 [Petrimonas sp.]|nr:hypothetical protein [Christensenella sp.]MEA4950098.1 hypothetical protein [Petrimonas sp.]